MMCRNGTSYGVRLAGSDEVFLAAAPPVEHAMYYPDYGPETSAPDIGDSAILELVGLGGAAAAALLRSPASSGRPGRRSSDDRGDDLRSAPGEQPVQAAHLEQRGDSARGRRAPVVELNTTPKVTTGILHASSGVGQIGAGVAAAPIECFRAAVRNLAARCRRREEVEMAERTVRTRWDGGMRAVTQAGNFEVVVDEPERSGGTDTGPQPTDLLLVSVSSCIALALAWAAGRRASICSAWT